MPAQAKFCISYGPDFKGRRYFERGTRREKIDGKFHTVVSRQVVCMFGPYPTYVGWICRRADGTLYRVFFS